MKPYALNLNHNNYQDPAQWPSIPFSLTRLWDTGTTWADIETSAGKYNFSGLDSQLSLIAAHGITEFIYTVGNIPHFYAADGVTPPTDLTQFAVFVSKVVAHIKSNFPALTMYWEQWNEPNLKQFWNGTAVQLVAVSRAAYAVLNPSGIKVISPAGSGGTAINSFILSYLNACAGNFPFDIFSPAHGYLTDKKVDPTSGMTALLNDIKVKKNTFKISSMPVWITEGSWGVETDYIQTVDGKPFTGLTDDQKVFYLTQMYVLVKQFGVEVFVWYAFNNTHGWGVLATGTPPIVNAAGHAFESLQNGTPFNLVAVQS